MSEANWTEYFTAIEEAFIRLKGRHVLLSPQDWALIERWWDGGIPLDVALRGLVKAFESKTDGRPVHSLRYCEWAVEAEFRAWLRGREQAGIRARAGRGGGNE